jgi:putative ABC transport system permease protein
MSVWSEQVRYALRSLGRSPGFAAAIVLSLGLAIGANTAIFSFFDAILLRQLPFGDADRLMRIRELRLQPGKEPAPIAVQSANLVVWKQANHSFEDFACQVPTSFNLTGDGDPESISGATVSHNFLRVLRVRPILGRDLLAEEDLPGHPARVALISHGLWSRRFGADPAIVGRTILVDQQSVTVIGVLPPKFKFPYDAEVWEPLGLDPDDTHTNHRGMLNVFGRLRPGVTAEQATADMRALAARLAQEHPATNAGWSVQLKTLREDLVGDVRPWLYALFGASGFVLLIACANAANLLLARVLHRTSEVSVRVALGSSRLRAALPFLTQSVLLALISGAFGILLAYVSLGPLAALSPLQDMDAFFQESTTLDLRVLGFSLLLSLAVGVLFGLVPAARASRPELQSLLKEGGRTGTSLRSQRLLKALVVSEIAVALVLVAGAGLMLRSFQKLQQVSLGFDEKRLLAMEITLPATRYPDRASQVRFYNQVLEKLRALPGIEAAGVTTNHPFTGERRVAPFLIEDRPPIKDNDFFFTNHRVVSPGYLETLGAPLLRGRSFTAADREDSLPVVIISKRFADVYFPGTDPLGKRLRPDRPNLPWMTIVGVAGDVKDTGDYAETWYVPYDQNWRYTDMNILVRTRGDPLALAHPVRQAIWSLDRNQPVGRVAEMATLAAETLRPQRFSALLYGLFGGLALILAVLGIYAVMSYLVALRLREFGIRMALGAQRAQLQRLVLRRTMVLTLLGVTLGMVGALALGRFLSSLLYNVAPDDPLTFGVVALGLSASALLASLLPAHRATRVNPVTALRYE